jgi:hypothetical protein
MYLGDFTVGQTVTCRFHTTDASGAPVTLAGSPVARVRRGSGSGTTITTGVTLTVDVVTGQHNVDVDTSSGYIAAADYTIELSAGTVSGVSVAGRVLGSFSIANRAGALESSLQALITTVGAAGAGLTATAAAVWAVATRLLTAGTNIVLAKGVGVTGFNDLSAAQVNAEADTAIADAGLATAANLATVAGYLDTEIASILADTNELQADWTDGGRLDLILDARASQTSVDDLPTNAELATSQAAADDATLAAIAALNNPSAGAIADQVWEETLADHSGTSGSTAAALNAAGSAGDPWNTALPGAYGAGTAGKIIGDNINATIGSRASQTSVDDLPTNAEFATALGTADDAVLAAIAALNNLSQANIRTAIGLASANLDTQLDALPTNAELATALAAADDAVLAAIAALNNLSQANVRTAVGLASANLDTQLAALAAFVDTEVAAIKAKTDNLPIDPADASDIAASFTSIAATLTTISGYIDSEVAAIKAKTDNLPAAPAAVGDIPTAAQVADKVLLRSLASGADGGRTVRDALRFNRNRFTIAGGTLTVYEEDDATIAWTAVITQTAGDPVSASDPA